MDMSKIPDKPQDIFDDLTKDYQKIFGSDLVSLILYGSAASGSYIKGKSDINLLVVVTSEAINQLENSLDTVKTWRNRRVAVPLFLTKDFIAKSLDCYPIEFLNIKNNHILIYGENVLAQINLAPEDLRLQIERELKGKLLLLRQGYLETEGDKSKLKQLISRSLTDFIFIFKAFIYFKQQSMPRSRRDTIKEMAKLVSFDTETFLLCVDIKEGIDKLSGKEVAGVFRKYLREVENICNIVDAL
jgi:predicted nucleotidyltransferase